MLDQGQWSKVLTIDPGHNLTAVACGAISYCVALDSVGNEVTYNGTWSSPETLDSVSLNFQNVPDSISCPTEASARRSPGSAPFFVTRTRSSPERFLLHGRVRR